MRKSVSPRVAVIPVAGVFAAVWLGLAGGAHALASSEKSLAESTVPAHEAQAVPAPALTVYKHRFCFCCKKWIDHLQAHGMQTPVVNASNDELSVLKGKWRIPQGMQGCHTGVYEGKYVFEGHVPARLIRRYLANPPAGSIGLTVPGMPAGSPGMYDGEDFVPYTVYMVMRDGDYRFYTRVERPETDGEAEAAIAGEHASATAGGDKP